MCDAQSIKICIKASVLEFSAIVTSDVLYLGAIVVHYSIGEASEDILHFSLVKDYVHPSISRYLGHHTWILSSVHATAEWRRRTQEQNTH